MCVSGVFSIVKSLDGIGRDSVVEIFSSFVGIGSYFSLLSSLGSVLMNFIQNSSPFTNRNVYERSPGGSINELGNLSTKTQIKVSSNDIIRYREIRAIGVEIIENRSKMLL